MKKYHFYLIALLVLPWFSIPLLGKKNFKKYFLSSFLICLFVVGESFIAKKRVWWWFFKTLTPKWPGETSLNWGPFFIGSMWILKFTMGKPVRYFLTNFTVHYLFVYVLMKYLKSMGYASLIRLKRYQLLGLFTLKATLLYGFQYLVQIVSSRSRIKKQETSSVNTNLS